MSRTSIKIALSVAALVVGVNGCGGSTSGGSSGTAGKGGASGGGTGGTTGAGGASGGTGGTVAVFGKIEALREQIPQIAREYSRRIGRMPDIFDGTSSGAVEFGARRYRFGAKGWQHVAF